MYQPGRVRDVFSVDGVINKIQYERDSDRIKCFTIDEIQNISIFNYVGQTIYNGIDIKINTSNFEAGIYLIKIETKEGIETQKITIR